MLEFRPRLTLFCLISILSLALGAAFDVRAGLAADKPVQGGTPQPSAQDAVGEEDQVHLKDKDHNDAYVWAAAHSGSNLRLRGSVPSEEDHGTVLGMAKANFPDLEVEDRLKVAAGVPNREQWLGAVSFGLKQLAHLKQGSARLLGVGLKVNGEARSAADYAEVKKAL